MEDDDTNINDNRESIDFKGLTFSKYNKNDVKKALMENLSEGKIESACHWSSELICAGHFMDLWELILLYMSKNIHLGNPKIVIYLANRYEYFKSVVDTVNYTSIIQLRNNLVIRKLFAEIMCILSQSKTMHSFELIKINLVDAFDHDMIQLRIKASSTHYLEPFYKPGDPKSLFIAFNEFSYCISIDSLDMTSACYWIEWIIEYENKHKKINEKVICEERKYGNIDPSYQTDAVWIIWDAILHYGKLKCKFTQQTLSSLQKLFCIRYTTSTCKKRRYILYFAVGLLIDNVKTNIELSTDKSVVKKVVDKINCIYNQVKINEDYSTNRSVGRNEKKKRIEESIKKLEMIDQVSY